MLRFLRISVNRNSIDCSAVPPLSKKVSDFFRYCLGIPASERVTLFPISDTVGNQSTVSQFRIFREKPRSARLFARRRRQNDFSALFFVKAEKHTHESVTLPPFGKNFALLNFSRYSRPILWLSVAFLLFTIILGFPHRSFIKSITILHTVIYILVFPVDHSSEYAAFYPSARPSRNTPAISRKAVRLFTKAERRRKYAIMSLKEYPGNIKKSRKTFFERGRVAE